MSEKGGARKSYIAFPAAPDLTDECELVVVEFD